jgi:ribosome biogenesis GTPase
VQEVRDDDAKGRHTTTGRYLVAMTDGGWLIDTPGMREVQLSDAYDGIGLFFDDLTALSLTCKFRNCRHAGEPGCSVQGAIAAGHLDPARLVRWQKLLAEDGTNTATMETSALRAAGRRFYPKKK